MSDHDLDGYLDGLAAGELRAQWCEDCAGYSWPPRAVCPRCTGAQWEWRALPRTAELYTWTVVGRSNLPEFRDATPYAVGVAAFPGTGVRVIGLLDADPETLRFGMPVSWRVEPRGDLGPQPLWSPTGETTKGQVQ